MSTAAGGGTPGSGGLTGLGAAFDRMAAYRCVRAEARARDGWESLGDMGRFDYGYGHIVHAIVELSEALSDEDLRGLLASRLVTYKLPRILERDTEPLRDDPGEVRRGALRAARIQAR